MNEHDLLDAIGDIDPKHIESAGGKDKAKAAKRSNVARFRSLYLAAAGLLLLVVAGVVFRNIRLINGICCRCLIPAEYIKF